MMSSVVVGTVVHWFHNDVSAHHNHSWGEYHISAEQHDDVLAQLVLLHMPVNHMVDPEDGKDNPEEEVSQEKFGLGHC